MSELMNLPSHNGNLRWRLLATVSALSLLASISRTSQVLAAEQNEDHPAVWIELGGQLEQVSSSQGAFSPPFMSSISQENLLSALDVQKPPAYSIGAEGKISVRPDGTDWVFSASVQYGRSNAARHRHQQTGNAKVPVHLTKYGRTLNYPTRYYPTNHQKFADGKSTQYEAHTIADFQAGKDVGLGIFGRAGESVISAGVRIAQLSSRANVTLRAEPDLQYPTAPISKKYQLRAWQAYNVRFHDDAATVAGQDSFSGIGPSIAWSASTPIAGNLDRGEFTLDWGTNGAILFGRQKAKGRHQTTVKSYDNNHWQRGGFGAPSYGKFVTQYANNPQGHPTAHHTNVVMFNRVRTVVVPNLGGFAGVSVRYSNAQLSLGYRADFFFGAIDGGIDTRQTENRGFFGPFATISVGVGG